MLILKESGDSLQACDLFFKIRNVCILVYAGVSYETCGFFS